MSTPYRALVVRATIITLLGAGGCAPRLAGPADPRIAVMGRVDRSDPARWRIGYPGVTLRVAFEGPTLLMRASCSTAACRVGVTVDGGSPRVVRVASGDSWMALADALPEGPHAIEVVTRTEAWQGILGVRAFQAPRGRLLAARPWPARRMLFIGDSVTCGEAIDRGADCAIAHEPAAGANGDLSYGMLLARALGAQAHLICYGGRGLIRDWRGRRDVANGPRLFDLAVADDRPRAFWDHAGYLPDVVVVSLGTNDFNLALGAFPAREEFVTAYVAFVRAIRARYPAAPVVLTEGAIVNDEDDPQRPQKAALREYLGETARRLADGRVTVFPAQHYPGDACNPHPTREQHAAMARDLEPAIRRVTGW
jgi:lysophospholipase L1-like esterase